MTATEELRRMLDERGVDYRVSATGYSIDIGPYTTAYANRSDTTLDVSLRQVTPEQAVAATLGRGTCHVKAVKKLGDSFGFKLSCGHSMVNPFDDRPDYCPWCGAKVVDA